MALDLNDVTICAIDSANVPLSVRALHISMAQCKFSDAVLFSPVPVDGSFRTVRIEALNSLADYQKFSVNRLPALIETAFVLIVQWDGYVINPSAWKRSFLDYDYIGAKWPYFSDRMRVGNGGFCLRSKKLLTALRDPQFTADGHMNDDELICRRFRPVLERDFGIRFAPEDVADQFSYENARPDQPTFGFHGLGNMWRHVEDTEMIKLVNLLAPYTCRTPHYVYLMLNYFHMRKFDPLISLYAKLKAQAGDDETMRLMREHSKNDEVASLCVKMCEQLLLR